MRLKIRVMREVARKGADVKDISLINDLWIVIKYVVAPEAPSAAHLLARPDIRRYTKRNSIISITV